MRSTRTCSQNKGEMWPSMPPIDHEPRLLGHGDIPFTDWSACMALTWESGYQIPHSPSLCKSSDREAIRELGQCVCTMLLVRVG